MAFQSHDFPDNYFRGVSWGVSTLNEVSPWSYHIEWSESGSGWQYKCFYLPENNYDYYLSHVSLISSRNDFMNTFLDYYDGSTYWYPVHPISGRRYSVIWDLPQGRALKAGQYGWFEIGVIQNSPTTLRNWCVAMNGYMSPRV